LKKQSEMRTFSNSILSKESEENNKNKNKQIKNRIGIGIESNITHTIRKQLLELRCGGTGGEGEREK